ncbi:MAG: DUF5085 family protein [Clostridiales Family XIII bacterium]|jgi:hypothetical protein|nr:DUF5085 family protein [Clostridiales Family XIII bacterium]
MAEINDFMQYKNVLWKSYRIPKDKQELAINDFLKDVISMNVEMKTLPFFAIESQQGDEIKIKYYISIENNDPGTLPQGIHFDSYFGVDPTAATVLAGDFPSQSEQAYETLYGELTKSGLSPVTPVFVILGGDSAFQYAVLKVGYEKAAVLPGQQ